MTKDSGVSRMFLIKVKENCFIVTLKLIYLKKCSLSLQVLNSIQKDGIVEYITSRDDGSSSTTLVFD